MSTHYTITGTTDGPGSSFVTVNYEFGFGEQGSIVLTRRIAESEQVHDAIKRQLARRADIIEQLAAGGE